MVIVSEEATLKELLRRRRIGARPAAGWTAATAAVLTSALIAACGTEQDPVLAALRADPMATVVPPDATLATAEDTARDDGGILFRSKPRSTRVLRAFAPTSDDAQHVQEELQRTAVSSGWQLQPNGDPVEGTKQFDFGRARISVYTNEFVQPAQVVVVLEPEPGS